MRLGIPFAATHIQPSQLARPAEEREERRFPLAGARKESTYDRAASNGWLHHRAHASRDNHAVRVSDGTRERASDLPIRAAGACIIFYHGSCFLFVDG
jgi:hypothetical protein